MTHAVERSSTPTHDDPSLNNSTLSGSPSPDVQPPNFQNTIRVRGARQHNLKNIDLELPRDRLIVFTGVSGSGKSSLAFDTIFAEGQRRYVESLSAYARQFLGQVDKPDVDAIEGLSPAISIDQKSTSHNPRSTVGTVTEIYDYLRLLFGRAGQPHCPHCDRSIAPQTVDEMCDRIGELPDGTRFQVLAPVVRRKKGTHKKLLSSLAADGFVRVRVNGEIRELSDAIDLDKNHFHTIEVVIDRLVKKPDIQERLVDSLTTCLKTADGIAVIDIVDPNAKNTASKIEVKAKSGTKSKAKTGLTSTDEISPSPKVVPLSSARQQDYLKVSAKVAETGGTYQVETESNTEENNNSSVFGNEDASSLTHSLQTAQLLPQELIFSENFACPEHGAVMEELSPRLFSFNSPHGACPACHGIGSVQTFSPELVVPDPSLPVYGAIAPWSDRESTYYLSLLYSVGQAFEFDIQTPWAQLTELQQDVILYGSEEPIWIESDSRYRSNKSYQRPYEGAIPMLQRQYEEATSEQFRQKLEQYLVNEPCKTCGGKRLKPEALAVRIGPYTIHDFTHVSIRDCRRYINALAGLETELEPMESSTGDLTEHSTEYSTQNNLENGSGDRPKKSPLLGDRQMQIADLVLKEIRARLQFMLDVGLDYLTLDRPSMTLSGGEAQRIRLATQIGSGLTGVLYVLDEPSIGLHQRDNSRLLRTLTKLRGLGNTLIVVEHDEETIRAADHLVDIGPAAGIHGGRIVAQGELQDILQAPESLTGAYLSGRQTIPTPEERRKGNGRSLHIRNAHRNNLKHVDVEIPLGVLVSVTGVSGSGKSTLINELLYPALQHHLGQKTPFPKELDGIDGLSAIDKVIVIDQSPIGRTPRSNPATYTGVFDTIRNTFAETIEAKARGYKPGQFSFNVKGGRCEACGGQGVNVIEMNFLPNVYVQCEVCKGARYNRETLHVKYKNLSIADVLNLTVEESLDLFQNIPQAKSRLQTLVDVGLGYVRLGQSAPTLSGGEAQRLKLASELSRRATGKTLYLIDEPTTGLSFYDVHKLLDVIHRLVDKGNSVLVIEHNLDVIRCADWIIDLGPEGGNRGGEVVAVGTPEAIANTPGSYTGQYLKPLLLST